MLSKTVFILCVLLLGLHLRADDRITVTIVPETSMERVPAGISYSGNFYVVISNKSLNSVRFWKDWCSWGFYNLAFDIKLNNGKVYYLEKVKNRVWDQNWPDYYIVPPNSYFVISVKFSSGDWESFPDEVKNSDTILLNAIYSIPDDQEQYAKKYKVWMGKTESEWQRINFYR